MKKPISRKLHGLIADYPYVALVAAAPEAAGFTEEKAATALCRVMSGGVLISALLTRAEWGIFRVIPFKTHLALDVASGILAGGAPYLFRFSGNKRARNVFLAMSAAGFIAGFFTQTKEMPRDD